MARKDYLFFVAYFIVTLLIVWGNITYGFSPYRFYQPGWDRFQLFYSKTTKLIAHTKRFFVSRLQLVNRIQALEKEKKQLKKRVQQLKFLDTRIYELKKQLQLPDSPGGKLVAGKAINQNLTGLERTYRINRGYNHGLQAGDPVLEVINDTFVLRGEIHHTFKNHSLVILPGDPRFKIGVKIDSVGGRQFILEGEGYRRLVIDNFPAVLSVKPGERVYTAEASLIAPQNIYVGKIKKIIKGGGGSLTGNKLIVQAPPLEGVPRIFWVLLSDG